MAKTYRIGDLAREAEVPVETIRYYEREGLVPPPRRSSGNYRLYDDTHRQRLTFIRQCRLLDMTLEEIQQLLALKDQPRASCEEASVLLDEHIKHVAERIDELGRLKRDLQALRRRCRRSSAAQECGILTGLADGTATRAKPRSDSTRRAHPR